MQIINVADVDVTVSMPLNIGAVDCRIISKIRGKTLVRGEVGKLNLFPTLLALFASGIW